jgi:HEPN domain-containing protein
MNGRDTPERLAWREALLWLEKANEDARAVRLLLSSSLISPAAFHVQQATEKALKALLTAAAQDVRRIHDVVALADLARAHWPDLVLDPFPLVAVNEWYIKTRYPGIEDDAPAVNQIEEALAVIEALMDAIAERGSEVLHNGTSDRSA